MSFYVKVIQDSINNFNQRLTTVELRYPRFIHSEILTQSYTMENYGKKTSEKIQ